MSPLRVHPALATFPELDGALFDALRGDIQLNGQHLPIVLYEGMIWDGRARYRACCDIGIKPWLVPLRRKDPMEFYIESNYDRCGEPHSPERKAIIAILSKAGSADGRTKARGRRSAWIKAARAEFEDFVKGKPEPCAVCRDHVRFVHAHHSFPLSLQFECGVDDAIHDYQWLCPIHHKYVHVLLSGYLLGSRDLSFLDGVPDEFTEEWLAVEKSAQRGIDLCCDTLGRPPGENKHRRYDPPYSLYILSIPQVVAKANNWKSALLAIT